jgi:hypothetical protein
MGKTGTARATAEPQNLLGSTRSNLLADHEPKPWRRSNDISRCGTDCHREKADQARAIAWEAMNTPCHGEERSDAAIQLDFSRWIAAPAKPGSQ